MKVLFCHPTEFHPLTHHFEDEAEATEELGIVSYFASAELATMGDWDAALDGIPEGDGDRILYRGASVAPEGYEQCYERLEDRGWRPVVTPESYAETLYVPNYLPKVRDLLPPTAWVRGPNIDGLWRLAQRLGPPPYIIKDFVKSAKESWADACWVKPEADEHEFRRVARNLVDLRGRDLAGGLVVKKAARLRRMENLGASMPFYDEHRLFFWEGELVLYGPYHDAADDQADLSFLSFIGERLDSPFFCADVARSEDGQWILVELNDGGISTVPAPMDPRMLFSAILDRSG